MCSQGVARLRSKGTLSSSWWLGIGPPVDMALMGIPYMAKAILNCFGLGVVAVVKVHENGGEIHSAKEDLEIYKVLVSNSVAWSHSQVSYQGSL